MDVSWPLVLVSAAVFITFILLAFVCVDCRRKGPQGSIPQTNVSEEYIPSTGFEVVYPSQRTIKPTPSHLPSPIFPGTDQRRQSYAPEETASNPSYENPVPGPESLESDTDGYLDVLPQLSRTSSLSSDAQHDYENVPKPSSESEASSLPRSGDYLNVDPRQDLRGSTSEISQTDSEDSEGNYVNQPPMIHIHPSA
ncbi:uncharacterized protein PAE49_023817 isoform 2-T3 [Odontesthes bonariensis]